MYRLPGWLEFALARDLARSPAGGGYVTSIERTAYPGSMRAVSVWEMHEAFTPTAGEIA